MGLMRDIPETHEDYFPARYRAVEGSPRRMKYRFMKCSDPVCSREEEITDNGATPLPCDVVRKKFRQAGWLVGKNRRRDTCPTCLENARTKYKKEVELKMTTGGAPTAMMVGSGPVDALPKAMPSDDAPKTMGVDERRIIFGKVDECWAGKDAGYKTPWTDQAIAADLGVPLAWVAEVRAGFFGEVRDNQEIRELLQRVEKVSLEARDKIAEAFTLHREASALIERANKVNASVQELKRSIEGLIAISGRIERSLK